MDLTPAAEQSLITVGAGVGTGFLLLLGLAAMIAKFYRQVTQGQVLIVNTLRRTNVHFHGSVVIPIIHRSELMDISVKTIEIDRRGKEGLICQDNIRADIKVTFFVRVNKTEEDVLKVAQSVGCARASDQSTLRELFEAKFSEALKTVGKRLDFEDLYKERESFKDQLVQVIGKDLNGYMLEDAAIDFLEQTPVELLDKDNILDAQGIRKITELTTVQNVLTNEFRQTERKQITKQNVEADEAVFELEKQRAEAAARQKREIESIQARETAAAEQVKSEELTKSELARIKAEEEILINEQNKSRQVEVAQKNRERVVGIETERVQKDRSLEAINREREVELQRISKEKAVEQEKKAIADVISTRVAVERKVAAEEESIKDLRVTAEANRQKSATVIHAEAEAMERFAKELKAAEAQEAVAKHEARKQLTLADAALEAADKQAKAKVRLAEGVQAEQAAKGLAEARVKEADAVATEKQGMAQVRVQEADAAAIEKRGRAQAVVTRESLTAEAAGLQEKLFAEARGIAEKAESMKQLGEASRGHEEFRLRLSKERDVELAGIHVRKEIAEQQAKVLAEAFHNAKINIVGGDGAFFDRFVRAVSFGQSVDGAISHSDALQTVLKDYLDGGRNLPDDLKEILSRPGLSADAQNLTAAALLAKLAKDPKSLADAVQSVAKSDSPKR